MPRNKPTHSQLIFDKGAKSIQWGKESLLKKWLENRMPTYKRMKVDHYFTPYPKINSRLIIGLSLIPETIKLLENIGGNLLDIGLGNDFLNEIPKCK